MPNLELVRLTHGEVLYRPDEPIRYVYFPNDVMASAVASTRKGKNAEVGDAGAKRGLESRVLLGDNIIA